MVGYDKTIEMITAIVDRYNEMFPDIFKSLNNFEKNLLSIKPRHVFSKQDCQIVMKQSKMPSLSEERRSIISECILLLYNWYKSKVIYHIEEEVIEEKVCIDNDKIKLFPYSGVYLDLNFYSLNYEGCFITVTREQQEISLQRYVLIGFVEYNKKVDDYGIEPFMLEVRDGITVQEAFMSCYSNNTFLLDNVKRNVLASIVTISNLYSVIDTINEKKEMRIPSGIRRKVVSKTLSVNDSEDFKVTRELKFRYDLTSSNNIGSPKSPHMRRAHNRHYPIKDENGTIIGEKVITINEMRIHAEDENTIVIKVLPDR